MPPIRHNVFPNQNRQNYSPLLTTTTSSITIRWATFGHAITRGSTLTTFLTRLTSVATIIILPTITRTTRLTRTISPTNWAWWNQTFRSKPYQVTSISFNERLFYKVIIFNILYCIKARCLALSLPFLATYTGFPSSGLMPV